jgi:hypothetical protein
MPVALPHQVMDIHLQFLSQILKRDELSGKLAPMMVEKL